MEAVSFLNGEKWTDMPECACPVIARFCRHLNDKMDQGFRDRLLGYAPRLIGTASPEHEIERVEFLAWRAVKTFAPIALDEVGLHKEAEELRSFDISRGLSAAARAAAASAAADAAARAAAANAAAYAAYSAADADPDAIFKVLDGVLEIGPSGKGYQPIHIERLSKLNEILEAAA